MVYCRMHSNFPDCVCALQHHTHTHEQQQCRAGFFGDQTQPRLQTNGRSLSSTQNMHNAACCEKHCGSSCWKCGQNRYRAMTGTLQRQHQHMRVPIVCIADATSLPFMPKHVTRPKKLYCVATMPCPVLGMTSIGNQTQNLDKSWL
jgi:hypothetical protein